MEVSDGKKVRKEYPAIYREQLVTVEHFEIFKEELLNKIKNLVEGCSGVTGKKWLKSIDVRRLLGISPGTLQNLRINRILPFTKMGGVLYYDYEDIQRAMSDNRKHNQQLKKED